MSKYASGTNLLNDLLNLKITRTALIEEFLFERDIMLISSGAGAGKSYLALNLVGALSYAPAKNFLGLKIMRSAKVLYIQLEGDYEESVERLRLMVDGGMFIDENNIVIVNEKELDCMDKESTLNFFFNLDTYLKEHGDFKPEVCIIDPIYKLTNDDPCKGNVARAIIKFSDMLIERYECANVLIHHNVKEAYASNGEKINKDDATYGHSFIKNHVRTSYSMDITGEHTRVLKRKKGRGSDTKATIHINYDPEFGLMLPGDKLATSTAIERIIEFHGRLKKQNRITNMKEIVEECDVSYSRLRHLKSSTELSALFSFSRTKTNHPEIWNPL